MDPQRFLLTIQYDGTDFYGWQRQRPGQRSVQEVVENAIADLVGGPVSILASGRTDRGVHARGMPAHVDLVTRLRGEELRRAIDARLPPDVALMGVLEVAPDFHCRYQNHGKCYIYRAYAGRSRLPLMNRYAVAEHRHMDVSAMREAAAQLTGTHDYSAFATLLSEHEGRLTSQPDPDNPEKPQGNVRTVFALRIVQAGPLVCWCYFGDGFLRGMVRGLTGTLMDVGFGKLSADDVSGILRSGDRREAGANAPGRGLTLERVFFDQGQMERWMEYARLQELRGTAAGEAFSMPLELLGGMDA